MQRNKNPINRNFKLQIPLSYFTTWKVGGPAQWLVQPKSVDELIQVLLWSKKEKVPFHIIGAGSNLLISDQGLKGITICMKKMQGCQINKKSGFVEALAGEPIPNLARKVAKHGLHGMEWSIGIPGTVGGATVMNAGTKESCTSERLISVNVLSISTGEIFKIQKEELEFSYRNSILQKEELIVISTLFQLETGHNTDEILNTTNNHLNHRLKTQPYHLPTCGSVFRNPEGLKAGRIIEELGLKGFCKGDAEVSSLHANFIINKGNATAKDISHLISTIQEKVNKKHGFILHPEVKLLGFE